MPKLSYPVLHTNKKYLSSKYALFNIYLTTLTLTSYPNTLGNNRVSALQGLTRSVGKKKLNTQKWFWLIGPLWSQWSLWFDTLVLSFKHRGVCIPIGTPETELFGKAFTWLTAANNHVKAPLGYSLKIMQHSQADPLFVLPSNSFWLITAPVRMFEDYGLPTFTLKGSHNRNRTGWAVLPGPLTNKGLNQFLLVTALVAYRLAKG